MSCRVSIAVIRHADLVAVGVKAEPCAARWRPVIARRRWRRRWRRVCADNRASRRAKRTARESRAGSATGGGANCRAGRAAKSRATYGTLFRRIAAARERDGRDDRKIVKGKIFCMPLPSLSPALIPNLLSHPSRCAGSSQKLRFVSGIYPGTAFVPRWRCQFDN